MSQRAVERAVGKLVTDEGFRNRFFRDPRKVSFNEGFELSHEELEALARIPSAALAALSERIDDRICRLHVPGERNREECAS
jgi:hypothetical protein